MLTRSPRVGLLPHLLRLYDEIGLPLRTGLQPFLEQVATRLSRQGLEVTTAPICCVRDEFQQAIDIFAAEDVDLIVSLHLSYSPSLESVDLLAATDTPLLLLDTTVDFSFDQDTAPERILYNHGIHGVQDLACMLRRRGREYHVVAGAPTDALFSRAADIARGAAAARLMHGVRALRIGRPFEGMGDFAVDPSVLASRFGMQILERTLDDLAAEVEQVTDDAIDAETARDHETFACEAPADVHRRSVRVGLGLRRLLERESIDAFSLVFLEFDRAEGPVDTVPFLEVSKAMARGVGYGGEGDVLTAALVGALSRTFERTTFCEMFCPDWAGGTVFLSHMGEINPSVAATTPRLIEKDYTLSPTGNPAYLTCAPAPGPAVLVNLAPGPDDAFDLILAPVTVEGDTRHPEMRDQLRGWIRPRVPLDAFLERYSYAGGTHHCALVLGEALEGLMAFAEFAGLDCQVIA